MQTSPRSIVWLHEASVTGLQLTLLALALQVWTEVKPGENIAILAPAQTILFLVLKAIILVLVSIRLATHYYTAIGYFSLF